jgi:hypothetical protein
MHSAKPFEKTAVRLDFLPERARADARMRFLRGFIVSEVKSISIISVEMTESEIKPLLTQSVSLIAEIVMLCVQRPDLMEFAHFKLTQIASDALPKKRAQDAINDHLKRKGAELGGCQPAFPRTSDLRTWAEQIGKWHGIRFYRKEMRRKEKIMDWLNANWNTIESDFLRLLDSQEANGEARP